MDSDIQNLMNFAVVTENEQCFLCGKPLEIGSMHNKCTKLHLDNYEKFVQRHEVYKHIFNVRFMEYCSNEGQIFSTCSECFAGIDELLFINNQVEELESQLSFIVESLTTEILQSRNKYTETGGGKDPLELDPLDTVSKTEYSTLDLADIADLVTKVEVDVQDDTFDFHCPTPPSPEDSWDMGTENETLQNTETPPPLINNIPLENKTNEPEPVQLNDLDLDDIYSLMSSREIRIVLKKLDMKQIMNYTKRTDTTTGLKLKNENVKRVSKKIDCEFSDWNSDNDSASEESDFEMDDKPKRKLKRGRGRPKTPLLRRKRRKEMLEYFNCEICGDKMKPMLKNDFKKHIQSHPKYKPYKCKFPNCEVKFRWTYALIVHEKEHVGSVDGYNCDICGNKYRGPYELRKHKQRVHVDGQEVCKICGNKYKLKQNLMVHVKRFHGISHLEYEDTNSVTQFCCDICQQSYSSESMLESHNLRFHSQNVDFFCDFCDTNVTPVRSLTYINTANKKLHTIGNIIKCTRKICQARFNCTEKYNQHKREHRLQGRATNRTRKYKTEGTLWKRPRKKEITGEKNGRKLVGRKRKIKKEEEVHEEVKNQMKSEENLKEEKRPRKRKLANKKISSEDNLMVEVKLNPTEENLATVKEVSDHENPTGEKLMIEGSDFLNEIPEDINFLSDNGMLDDDYQSNEEEKADDSDWLSDEKSKKNNKQRKRKYTKRIGKVREKTKREPKEKKAIFKCEKCDLEFRKEVRFIKHNIEVHQQENSLLSFAEDQKKELTCGICGKGFRKQTNLTRHIELHKKVKLSPEEKLKSLTCDVCGRVFKQRFNLKIHKKTHIEKSKRTPLTPEEEAKRSVGCNICGKILKSKSTLTHHLKNHFNVQLSVEEKLKTSNIKCEECGKPLTTMANLRRHLKQAHMEDRPFKCPQEGCSRAYKDEANLSKHLDGHLKVIEYDCDLCHKKFYRKDYLQLHFRRNHATTSKQYQTWKHKSLRENSGTVGESDQVNDIPVDENVPGCD